MKKAIQVLRVGILPQLSQEALAVLEAALVIDDPRIVQGRTVVPPTIAEDCECVAADPIAFAIWQSEQLTTVGEVESRWLSVIDAADMSFAEPAAARYFLNWLDEVSRQDMRAVMLAEVRLARNVMVAA